MFGNDYITKMISSFAAVVAQLMGFKKEMKHEEVFKLVNDTLEKYYRLNSKLLQSLTNDDLLALMHSNGILDNEKTLTIAYLLKAEGESFDAQGSTDESYKRYLTSLILYLAAADNEANARIINYHSQIEDLWEKLRAYELPVKYGIEMFGYFVIEGQYASAENLLYELAESNSVIENETTNTTLLQIHTMGMQFYEKLLQKENALLIQGGLPHDEVIEGFTQFKQLCGL